VLVCSKKNKVLLILEYPKSVNRFFIELAYNGSKFHGWQIQINAKSIQAEINNALSIVSSEKIETTAAGRTDTGVHALQMFAHFDSILTQQQWNDQVFHLNCILHEDIVVKRIFRVNNKAHARFDAISRSYEYHVSLGKNPFNKDFAYNFKGKPDIIKMNEAANLLFQYEDFSCFSKSNTQVFTNNCKIFNSEWKEFDDTMIFYISANRFLRNMVRAITGTLLNIGVGKINLDEFKIIIENKNRSDAGMSVPAKGLFLTSVCYPDTIAIQNND